MANTDREQILEQTVPMSAKGPELLSVPENSDAQFLGSAYSVTQDENESMTGYQKTTEFPYIQENQLTDYLPELKQWVNLLAQEKQRALQEQERLHLLLEQEREVNKQLLEQETKARQELEKAKQEQEDIMGMVAHKFQGPVFSVQYNAEYNNQRELTLQSVQTIKGLLKVFSIAATEAHLLRQKLQQDQQGNGTIAVLLEKVLLSVIKQVTIIDHTQKIRQHYFCYAKQTEQVPENTTRKQWRENYGSLETQLQAEWEKSFWDLLTQPHLDKLITWIDERFFPLEVSGFDDETIHFEPYGATESTLMIVLTEVLLNAFKYYSSESHEPVKLNWQHGKAFCCIICENPTQRSEQRIGKGQYKGYSFLGLLARNLQSPWEEPLPKDDYRVEWHIPTHLLVEENK